MSQPLYALNDCHKAPTRGSDGSLNGQLVELYKKGGKTLAYITIVTSGAFKGFHLQQSRECNFIVLQGAVKVIMVKEKEKQEVALCADILQHLTIPTGVYIGIENIGTEDAWVLNMPSPPYDPKDIGGQLEKTPAEIQSQLSAK